MKLIIKPETIVETYEMSTPGGRVTYPGRTSYSNVEIAVVPQLNTKDEVWNKLKYGNAPNLDIAFADRQKIDRIDFPEANIILYGVIPVSWHTVSDWEGKVFECHIDYYEET